METWSRAFEHFAVPSAHSFVSIVVSLAKCLFIFDLVETLVDHWYKTDIDEPLLDANRALYFT